jgi:hypothetical protein
MKISTPLVWIRRRKLNPADFDRRSRPPSEAEERLIRLGRWSVILNSIPAFFAVAISGWTVFMTFFHQDHSLTASIEPAVFNVEGNELSVDVTFRNTGNRDESLQKMMFAFPVATDSRSDLGSGLSDLNVIKPFYLKPGEFATRRLRQSVDFSHLFADSIMKRRLPADRQIVSVEFVALDSRNVPVSTVVDLARLKVGEQDRRELEQLSDAPRGTYRVVEVLRSKEREIERKGVYYRFQEDMRE